MGAEGRNLETLVDEAWRVFSNREEGKRGLVAVISDRERGRCGRGPPRQGPSRLDRDQCAICKKYGHWKDKCPEQRLGGPQEKGKIIAHVNED